MFLGLGATCGPGDTPLHDAGVFDRSVTQLAEQRFPVLGWDPILKAMAIAGEFAATGKLWQRKELCPPPPSDPTEDIAKLIEYRDGGRNQRREEIATQAMSFYDYFAQLLSASPPSRPHTHVLIMTGIYVGGFVVAYWKLKHMRPRPVQVCPRIFPTIMTPPHPSYPSGHALESALAAECAKLVAPLPLHDPLDVLAERIGRNREYAGVHYPSDTDRSLALAKPVFDILNNEDLVPEFRNLVELARQEW